MTELDAECERFNECEKSRASRLNRRHVRYLGLDTRQSHSFEKRQGCVLAPVLFCRAMDWIMDQAMPHCGVTIDLSEENIPDSNYDIAALEGDLADC